jgi:hypothetical protein
VVEVDVGAPDGDVGAGVARAVFGVGEKAVEGDALEYGAEVAAPDAAAYEPDVDVLGSVFVWLSAAPIMDGGGAGGSSERSCSESSGSEMSSMGAEARIDEVDAALCDGAAGVGAAECTGVRGSGSSSGSRSNMGSNWSGGGSGADCADDADGAAEAAAGVDAIAAGVGADAAGGDAAGSGGVGADE